MPTTDPHPHDSNADDRDSRDSDRADREADDSDRADREADDSDRADREADDLDRDGPHSADPQTRTADDAGNVETEPNSGGPNLGGRNADSPRAARPPNTGDATNGTPSPDDDRSLNAEEAADAAASTEAEAPVDVGAPDPDDSEAEPPVLPSKEPPEGSDPLIWRLAYRLFVDHRAHHDGFCVICREYWPCASRQLAELGLQQAMRPPDSPNNPRRRY